MEAWRRELFHYNHNHDALGRFASAPGSGSSNKGRVFKKKTKAAAVETKKPLTDEEAKRIKDKTLKNPISAKEVYKNKDLMTTQELKTAIDRIQTEKNLKQLRDQEIQAGQKWVQKLDKIAKITNKVADYYNTYQRVSKIFDDASRASQRQKEEAAKKDLKNRKQKVIRSDSAEQLYKNRHLFTADEYEKLNKRLSTNDKVRKRANAERAEKLRDRGLTEEEIRRIIGKT